MKRTKYKVVLDRYEVYKTKLYVRVFFIFWKLVGKTFGYGEGEMLLRSHERKQRAIIQRKWDKRTIYVDSSDELRPPRGN